MARAKRHYIPGQIWHLTHRCHKREFLLKLVQDKWRWLQWTESIAVGSKSFIETIREKLGILSKGRKIIENDGGFHLREETGTYIANNEGKKANIDAENTYLWI